jgi:hypothetical protein
MADPEIQPTPDLSHGDAEQPAETPTNSEQSTVTPTTSLSPLDSLFNFAFWSSSGEVEIAQYSDGPSEKPKPREDKVVAKEESASENQVDGEASTTVTSSFFNFAFWTSLSVESKDEEPKEEEKKVGEETLTTTNNTEQQQQPIDPSVDTAAEAARRKQIEAMPLDKFRIATDDVEYLKEHLTATNMRLEVVPRWNGTGAQYTPLGYVFY